MFYLSDSLVSYFEVLQRASSFLVSKNDSEFAAEWLMRERLDWTKTDLIKHYREIMPEAEAKKFQSDFNQYLKGRPMQQIIGHDWFYGRKFKVTNDTLIPRPETEEWMNSLLKKLPDQPLKVLDIGTGTGVLAITQKLERPNDDVKAVDISNDALKVAKVNAKNLGAKIKFIQSDLFDEIKSEKFDLILSNPPYISEDEIDLMDPSVLKYEPKEALFAENKGLAIYELIVKDIANYLKNDYQIAVEIGYKQGKTVSKLFQTALPEAEVRVWNDFNGLNRLVWVKNCE